METFVITFENGQCRIVDLKNYNQALGLAMATASKLNTRVFRID